MNLGAGPTSDSHVVSVGQWASELGKHLFGRRIAGMYHNVVDRHLGARPKRVVEGVSAAVTSASMMEATPANG